MSKYKGMYKENGLKLGRPEVKYKGFLASRRVRRSVLADVHRDDSILERREPEPIRDEPETYKKMKIRELEETEKKTGTKSKSRPFVVGIVRHKIHSPPFLNGSYNNNTCSHFAKGKNQHTHLQSFAPRNYKFHAPKGLHLATPTLAEHESPFTFDSVLRSRPQNIVKRRKIDFENITMRSRNVKKSPESSPLRTVTNTLAVQEEELEGVCIFGRLNLAKALNRSGSRMSSDSISISNELSTNYSSTPIFDGKKNPLFDSTTKVGPKKSLYNEIAYSDSCDEITTTREYTPSNEDIIRLPEGHNHRQKSLKDPSVHEDSSDAMRGISMFSPTILLDEKNIDGESSHFKNIDFTNSILNIENPSMNFTSPTLCNVTYSLKSSSETVQSDEENNIMPQSEETTLKEIKLINGIEQRPPILSEVIDNSFSNITIRKRHNHDVFMTSPRRNISTNHIGVEEENSYFESVENSSTENTAIFIGHSLIQTKLQTEINPVQDIEIGEAMNLPSHQLFINQKDECNSLNSSQSAMKINSSSNTSIPHYLFEMSKRSSCETKDCVDTLQSLQSKEEKRLDKTINDDYSDNSMKDQNNGQYWNKNQMDISALSPSGQDLVEENAKEVNMSFNESEITAQTSMNDFNTLPIKAVLLEESEDLHNNSFVNNRNVLPVQFNQESCATMHEKVSNVDSLNCSNENKNENGSEDVDIPLFSFVLSDSFFNISKPQVEGPLFDAEIHEKHKKIKSNDGSNILPKNQMNITVQSCQEISAGENLKDKSSNEDPKTETAFTKELKKKDNNVTMDSSICLPQMFEQESFMEISSLSITNDMACSVVNKTVNKELNISIPLNFFKLNKEKTLSDEQALELETMERTQNIEINDSSNVESKDESKTVDEQSMQYQNMIPVSDKSEGESSKSQEITPVPPCDEMPQESLSNNSIIENSLNEGIEKSNIAVSPVLPSISPVTCLHEPASVDRNEGTLISKTLGDHNKPQITIDLQNNQTNQEIVESFPDSISTTGSHNPKTICQKINSLINEEMETMEIISSQNVIAENMMSSSKPSSVQMSSPVVQRIEKNATRSSKNKLLDNTEVLASLKQNTNEPMSTEVPSPVVRKSKQASNKNAKKKLFANTEISMNQPQNLSEPFLMMESKTMLTRSAKKKLLTNNEAIVNPTQNTNESLSKEISSPVIKEIKTVSTRSAKNKLFANTKVMETQSPNLSEPLSIELSSPAIQGIRTVLTRSAKKKLVINTETMASQMQNTNELLSIEVSSPVVQGIKKKSTRSAKKKIVAAEIVANSTPPRPKQKFLDFQFVVNPALESEDSSMSIPEKEVVQSMATRVINEISPIIVIDSVNPGECKSPVVLPKQQKKLNDNSCDPDENEVVDLISDDEEDYKSFLSRVLAVHAPTEALSPGSPRMSKRRTPALQVTLSIDSPKTCKTPKKRVQKTKNGSPALSPLLKLDAKKSPQKENEATPIRLLQLRSRNISVSPSPRKITPMTKARGGRKNMD